MSDYKGFVHEFEKIKAPEQWKIDAKKMSEDNKFMTFRKKFKKS